MAGAASEVAARARIVASRGEETETETPFPRQRDLHEVGDGAGVDFFMLPLPAAQTRCCVAAADREAAADMLRFSRVRAVFASAGESGSNGSIRPSFLHFRC